MRINLQLMILLGASIMISCAGKEQTFIDDHHSLEIHRKLATREWLRMADDSTEYLHYFDVEYVMPDSLPKDKFKSKYIESHTAIPDYIKKAIFENRETFMMTIGEFFLAKPHVVDEVIISAPVERPVEIHVGYQEFYDRELRTFRAGRIWVFKYGFLWVYGEI